MSVSASFILHCEVVVAGVCRIDFSYVESRLVAVFPLILKKQVSTSKVTCQAVPLLRRLDAGLSPRRPRFDPGCPCGICGG